MSRRGNPPQPKYVYLSAFESDEGYLIIVGKQTNAQDAKTTVQNNNGYEYVFKLPSSNYDNLMFKYPFSEHYYTSSINNYTNEVSDDISYDRYKNYEVYVELTPRFNRSCNVYEFTVSYNDV